MSAEERSSLADHVSARFELYMRRRQVDRKYVEDRIKQNVEIDPRTTRCYLDATLKNPRPSKLRDMEEALGLKAGWLTSDEPWEVNDPLETSSETYLFDADFTSPSFISQKNFPTAAAWDAKAYDSVKNYRNDFFVDSFRFYDRGVIQLAQDDYLLGAIEMWPVTQNAIVKLKSGNVKLEEEFLPSEICLSPCADWYFGGILRRPGRKNRWIGQTLFVDCMNFWIESQLSCILFPMRLWVIPVRPAITRIATWVGFRRVGKALQKHKLMVREFENKEEFCEWNSNEVAELHLRITAFLR